MGKIEKWCWMDQFGFCKENIMKRLPAEFDDLAGTIFLRIFNKRPENEGSNLLRKLEGYL